MIENFESIVKEVDEMLMFREIDKLIKKHEKEKNKIKINKIKYNLIQKTDLKCQVKIKSKSQIKNDTKEEIFELPVRRVRRTIEIAY